MTGSLTSRKTDVRAVLQLAAGRNTEDLRWLEMRLQTWTKQER